MNCSSEKGSDELLVKTHIAPKTQTAEFMVFSGLMLLILTAFVLGLFQNRLSIEEASQTAPTRRIQDLVALLKQAEDKRSMMESELSRLRKKLVYMESQHNSISKNQSVKDPELQKLYNLAGLTAVEGKGIVITLEDNKNISQAKDSHTDPNAGKLQADDLLKLVNELKAAGATAISINDQRLVATSEIVSSGPAVSVNQTRLTQPVVTRVIGDPELLLNALKIRGGVLEYLEFFNIKVFIEKKDHLVVPPYKGAISN